jgi:hypothetical protein
LSSRLPSTRSALEDETRVGCGGAQLRGAVGSDGGCGDVDEMQRDATGGTRSGEERYPRLGDLDGTGQCVVMKCCGSIDFPVHRGVKYEVCL